MDESSGTSEPKRIEDAVSNPDDVGELILDICRRVMNIEQMILKGKRIS